MTKERGSVYRSENAWENLSSKIREDGISKVFIIVDENTADHCLPYFSTQIDHISDYEIIRIPSGEKNKNISTCLEVWEQLSNKGADRSSLIINLGGGVVTDLGGFVASTFKRGLSFINVPTSLIGMVDASIGGKTGVDLGHIKNQIGTIQLPEMILLDTSFLDTLPTPHFKSGLAEMLKHSLIKGEDCWQKLKLIDYKDKLKINNLIWESIEIKNRIVTEDPLEKGKRKILNFGHTLGHAIESHFLDTEKELLHGEAIAIGMILAAYISNQLLKFSENKLNDISTHLLSIFPKQIFSEKDIRKIIDLLVFDKKNRNGQVLFVLIVDFEIFKTDQTVSNDLIIRAFDYYKRL